MAEVIYSVVVDGAIAVSTENRADAAHRFEAAAAGSFEETVQLFKQQLLAEATKGVVTKKRFRVAKGEAKPRAVKS